MDGDRSIVRRTTWSTTLVRLKVSNGRSFKLAGVEGSDSSRCAETCLSRPPTPVGNFVGTVGVNGIGSASSWSSASLVATSSDGAGTSESWLPLRHRITIVMTPAAHRAEAGACTSNEPTWLVSLNQRCSSANLDRPHSPIVAARMKPVGRFGARLSMKMRIPQITKDSIDWKIGTGRRFPTSPGVVHAEPLRRRMAASGDHELRAEQAVRHPMRP